MATPGPLAAQCEPIELPAPTLTAPPIFTQVSLPSILTKPGPKAEHGLLGPARFAVGLPAAAGCSRLFGLEGSANADATLRAAMTSAMGMFRIQSSTACRQWPLADEPDADRAATAPDHFAVAPGSAVAHQRQP